MKKITFDDLLVKHDYYCSDNNYYSQDAQSYFDTFSDFYEVMGETDVDRNLCFRFDIHERDNLTYYAEIFIMQQRNGRFWPVFINSVTEEDTELIIKYLTPHWEKWIINKLKDQLEIENNRKKMSIKL